jgi:regulator of sirC expression with transglutaminase-like and TPR domain
LDISNIGLIDDDDLLLDLAALALSLEDHGDLALDRYLEVLNEIEEQVCEEGRNAFSNSQRAAALGRVLHGDLGFSGDAETYDAPVNADFVRVLERRKGLPISLAILYVAMARRAGWIADVLDVPGHVIVMVGEKDPALIDPFCQGVSVSRDELAAICRAYLGDAGDAAASRVTPMSNRQILFRLLNNQAIRAEQEGDKLRAATIYQRMTKAVPEEQHAWHQLARLCHSLGDVEGARENLVALLELTRDAASRSGIATAIASLGKAKPDSSTAST